MAKRSKQKKSSGGNARGPAARKSTRSESGVQKEDIASSNAEPSKSTERICSPSRKGATTIQPSWFNRDWVWGLTCVLAVIVAYSPVWWAGYIWDDDLYVTANPCIVGPLGLKEIWTTSAADICPLTLTTFWVEHALWGLAPLPYHLVNVLLHGACAVLLWRVLRSLRVPGAWLGAALWALHPVQVESVAWITEMKNTQSGLFFLLSILFFVKWLRARDRRTNRRGWNYALNFAFRRPGDGEQIVHGDFAGCALLVRLVDGGPVAVAQSDEIGAHLSHVDRRQRPVDMDARSATGRSRRSPMGADVGRSVW